MSDPSSIDAPGTHALVPQPHGGAIFQGRPPGFANPGTGRVNGLTPEIHASIIRDIRDGNYAQVAAAHAGITEQTFYNWLKWGEDGREPYRKLFEAVLSASAEAEKKMASVVRSAAEGDVAGDWKAGAWWLERRFPKRWGRQQRIELSAAPDLDADGW